MNTSNSQLDPNNLQFNSIRQANSEEIESSKQQYLTAKTILVEKLETVVRMLNAESAEQALSGEKRKEIVNLLDEARDAFNKMDFSSLDLYEKLNMGVIEPKWLDKNTNPQV